MAGFFVVSFDVVADLGGWWERGGVVNGKRGGGGIGMGNEVRWGAKKDGNEGVWK